MATNAQLEAKLAEMRTLHEQAAKQRDEAIRELCGLRSHVESALGTMRLYGTYLEESEIVMRELGRAQANEVLKSLFLGLRSTLARQREAVQARVSGLQGALVAMKLWEGKLVR